MCHRIFAAAKPRPLFVRASSRICSIRKSLSSFLAFLPQFIDPASPMKIPAFIALGLTFVTTGTIWCLILAWFASAFSERLRGSTTVANVLNRTVGLALRFSRPALGDVVALTFAISTDLGSARASAGGARQRTYRWKPTYLENSGEGQTAREARASHFRILRYPPATTRINSTRSPAASDLLGHSWR